MLTLTTALQGDALPQRQALYQLGNSLAAGEGGARDGFSHFRYIDQSQVLGYEGGGENIQVAADGCSQAVLPPVPGCAQVRLRDLVTGEEQVVGGVGRVLAMVGYRPDTALTQELQVAAQQQLDTPQHRTAQVHYCYASEGPMRLAASLLAAGGGGGDCLAQVAGGDDTLVSPEHGVFILGMKSYGRGSAFLLR